MKKISLMSVIFFLMMCSLFAQSTEKGWNQVYSDEGFVIVSPVEGTWANRQSLVLEVPEAYEVFYSFSGSHPMDSGFAYDGPVMIEAEGEVSLRIALVFPDGNAAVYTVDYTVASPEDDLDNPLPLNFRQPVVSYTTGQSITIPTGYSYRLGNSSNFLPGEKVLALQGGSFPHRYLPCEVINGNRAWRFVLSPTGIPATLPLHAAGNAGGSSAANPGLEKTTPQKALQKDFSLNNFTAGKKVEFYQAPATKKTTVEEVQVSTFTEVSNTDSTEIDPAEPPFQITDWSLLTFTRDKLIYSIDNGFWQATEGSIMVDRTVGHTIYWQSVAYEKGNPVYNFYLPPKPAGEYQFEGREAVLVALGPEFTFVPKGLTMEPVSSLMIDAFYGEELHSDFPIQIYYDGLYQGDGQVSVLVDKCPPTAPAIYSSSNAFYNRQDVTVRLGQFEEGQLYYSLEMIVSEQEGFTPVSMESLGQKEAEFDAQRMQEQFQPYIGEPLLLESHSEHGHLFHVGAFTQDKQGNASSITWFTTIVDPTNYYVASATFDSESASPHQPKGTMSNPFTSLQEAIDATTHLDFARIHVIDLVPVSESITINSNCQLYGTTAGSGLLFTSGAGITVASAEVEIKNCVLELQDSSSKEASKNQSLLSVAKGRLSLEDCEIFGDYVSSGTLLSATDAELSLINSGITLRSGEYGAIVSSLRSTVTVEGGQYTVIAPTAVVFSLSAGELTLSHAQCKVFGNLGRVAELTGVRYTLTNNKFYGIFENKNLSTAQLVPVWSDGRSRLLKDSGNIVSGFPGS